MAPGRSPLPALIAGLFLLLLVAACGAPAPTAAPAPRATLRPTEAPAASRSTSTVTPVPSFDLLFARDEEGMGVVVRLDGAGPTRLTDPKQISAWQPAVAPDGARVLVTARRDGQSDLALLPAGGGPPAWLTDHPTDDYDPAWRPDGTVVAWVSERDGTPRVYRMTVDAPEAAPLALPADAAAWRSREPVWGPDGSLYFTRVDEQLFPAIWRLDPDGQTLVPLTAPPFHAGHPALGPAGELLVVAMEPDPPWRALTLIEAGGSPRPLWRTTDWIGDPVWGPRGEWILFTRWGGPGRDHDLWALPVAGGEPRPVVSGPSWEADASPLPRDAGSGPPLLESPPAAVPEPGPPALGFNVANLDNAYLSHGLGFGWVKGFADWERAEPTPGQFRWVDIENTVRAAESEGLTLLLRVDRSPTWARPPDTTGSHPPEDLAAYAHFLETLAARYRGRVAAYELWNEPNLSLEWGEQPPDPERYVEMLHVARAALQRGDPAAKLVVGALAVTDDSARSMSDLVWLERFYTALDGARPYDALSTHPYGFGAPPDRAPEQGPGLRRLEAQRAIMLAWGDDSPLWLTELGYARTTPGWSLGEHEPWVVADPLQGQYLAATVDYVAATYPFVEAIFLFNLDFSTVDWYGAGEQMRAYAILDSARRPLPAYSALRARWLGQEPR